MKRLFMTMLKIPRRVPRMVRARADLLTDRGWTESLKIIKGSRNASFCM